MCGESRIEPILLWDLDLDPRALHDVTGGFIVIRKGANEPCCDRFWRSSSACRPMCTGELTTHLAVTGCE